MAKKNVKSLESQGIEITDVKIFPFEKKGSSLLAFVSVTFNDVFVVSGLKLMQGSKGIFVSMPSQKGKDDEYHDICFPLTSEARAELQAAILEEFNQ